MKTIYMLSFALASATFIAKAAVSAGGETAPKVEYPSHVVIDRMPPIDLPELMTTFGGARVKSVEDWEKVRRPEILDFFTRNMHGERPVDRPADLKFTPIEPDREMLGGKATRKQVRISFSGPYGSWSFDVLAFLPNSGRPVPAFVLMCNEALEHCLDPELKVRTEFFPVERLVERGYGIAAYKHVKLASDSYRPTVENGRIVMHDPPFTNELYA